MNDNTKRAIYKYRVMRRMEELHINEDAQRTIGHMLDNLSTDCLDIMHTWTTKDFNIFANREDK